MVTLHLGDNTNVNPARAGMILRFSTAPSGSESKPRASGDDPADDDGRVQITV